MAVWVSNMVRHINFKRTAKIDAFVLKRPMGFGVRMKIWKNC